MVLEEHSDAFTSIGVFLTFISVVVAGATLFVQQRLASEELRLQNEMFRAAAMLEYAKRYSSGDFINDRLALTNFLNDLTESKKAAKDILARLEDSGADTWVRIAMISDFFNELQWCLEQEICDKDRILSRFALPAVNFYTSLHLYLKCNWPGFAHNFEKLARASVEYLKETAVLPQERRYSFEVHHEACGNAMTTSASDTGLTTDGLVARGKLPTVWKFFGTAVA